MTHKPQQLKRIHPFYVREKSRDWPFSHEGQKSEETTCKKGAQKYTLKKRPTQKGFMVLDQDSHRAKNAGQN